jgi:AcrR family transcriptional regulator
MPTRGSTRTRPKLDRGTVIDRALAISDADGLEAVTIRRLAQDLSVSPMALYWHVADKEALLAAMADRMWAETEESLDALLGEGDGGAADDGWQLLRHTTAALVEVLRRHPSVAGLLPTRVMLSDAGLAVTERTLKFLEDKGFGLEAAADIACYVLISAVMLVSEMPGAVPAPAEDVEEHLRAKRIALASLSTERYPHVIRAAEYLTDCSSPDRHFERGIDMMVAGVRALAPTDR